MTADIPSSSARPERIRRVRFFNTFEPVTSFYRDLLPELTRHSFECLVVISSAAYRSERPTLHLSTKNPLIRYQRMPAVFSEASSRLAKITAAGLYVMFASLVSLVGRSVDVNFFMTQPPLYSIWGMALKMIRSQKYVCLLMDVYPDVVIESGFLRRNGLIAKATQAMIRASWRHADAVIVIGRCMAQRVIDARVDPSRVHQIHNWSDENHVHPVPANENPLRTEIGLQDKFVVLYSGNMGVSHTFDEILEVAKELKDDSRIVFLFVGRGSRKKEIERAVQKDQLTNVRLMPFQPPERLAQSLSLADLHLVTLRRGFEGLVVPSKTYGAMASGRPILYIGDLSGEIARMIVEQQVGIAIPVCDPASVRVQILAYLDDPDRRAREGENALQASRNLFNRQSALDWYSSLLTKVASQCAEAEISEL